MARKQLLRDHRGQTNPPGSLLDKLPRVASPPGQDEAPSCMTVKLLAHAAIVLVAVAVLGRHGQNWPKEAAYVTDAGLLVEGVGELTESCCEGPECVCYTRLL